MNKNIFIIILSIIVLSIILSGCSECDSSSDCKSKTGMDSSCIKGECSYKPTFEPNKCGNGRCEQSADENSCTCKKDCGTCSGKVKYENAFGKMIESQYHEQACNSDETKCVISIDPKLKKLEIKEYSLKTADFEMIITLTYHNPFEVNMDDQIMTNQFSINLDLKKTESNFVGPLKITGIKFFEGTNKLAEKAFNLKLEKGTPIEKQVPFIAELPTSIYTPKLDMKIDYEHERTTTSGDKQSVQEVGRKISMRDKITFVETGAEVDE